MKQNTFILHYTRVGGTPIYDIQVKGLYYHYKKHQPLIKFHKY